MAVQRYHPLLVLLHWLLALLLIGMLAIGSLVLKQVPNAMPEKLALLRVHMLMGASILVLMLVRLVTRLSTEHPPAASTGSALLDALAPWVHWGLYILVFGMLGTGVGMAALAGLPDTVFTGHGALPADFSAYPQRAVHGVLSLLLMAAIALHALAALYHHFIRHDGLLSRMAWRWRK